MTEQEACERARALFLTEDNAYGCAETALIVLQEAFGLRQPMESSVAMAFNGGVAWSGGLCGAVSGAAMAVGRLAGKGIADHKEAKALMRSLVASLLAQFRAEFGSTNCRELTGLDISTEEGHRAFVESKVWHGACMDQIAFVLRWVLAVHDEQGW